MGLWAVRGWWRARSLREEHGDEIDSAKRILAARTSGGGWGDTSRAPPTTTYQSQIVVMCT